MAFFSRTLNQSELNHSAIEKEAYAIVESIRKWRHYLQGRRFKLITDQRSVSFMFDTKHPAKVKNEKIQRWRIELSEYMYDIVYRPGAENLCADAFSRNICASINTNSLNELHTRLCHPGVTRMIHYVRMKNLPYSIEDIRSVTSSCITCQKLKPQFHKGSKCKAISTLDVNFNNMYTIYIFSALLTDLEGQYLQPTLSSAIAKMQWILSSNLLVV